MIIYKECEDLIEKSYSAFRELMNPTLMIIKLGGFKGTLVCDTSPWRGGEIDSPSLKDIITDCETLSKMYPLSKEILNLEEKYFNKFFQNFNVIQDSWHIMDLKKFHIMPFLALMTGQKQAYVWIIESLIDKYWNCYPVKWDVYIMKGQNILDRIKKWDKDGIKHMEDERRINNVDIYNYSIKKTKWYLLRRYYRNLPYREDKDLGYTENVYERGLSSKTKALEAMEKDKNTDFEPHHKCSMGVIMGSVKFQIWGGE
jgi:hypothetical protein